MNHDEAREILADSKAYVLIDEDNGTARLNGDFTIEELQAVLQLLEYND